MKRIAFAGVALAVAIGQMASGCTQASPNATLSVTRQVETTVPASDVAPEVVPGTIRVNRVTIGPSFVTFSGTAGLPDGTILLSQLSRDDVVLPWWSTNQDTVVRSGHWMLSVQTIGEVFQSGPTYSLDVWQKDTLDTKAHFMFDLVGPPLVRPWWQQIGTFIRDILTDFFHGRLWRRPSLRSPQSSGGF